MRNTLSRPESLKSYKLIRLLFNEGQSFFSYPYRIFYMPYELDKNVPAQYLISVSKRKIKTAVKRNRIKRLFRETYRTQKQPLFSLLEKQNIQILVAFIFVGDEKTDFEQMKVFTNTAINQILTKIQRIH